MEVLNSTFDIEQFYQLLQSSDRRLLMLDYDGTLSPFTTDREGAVPYPEIADTLEELFNGDSTRVVIVSGRTIDSLKKLLSFARLPELWGCHGLERLTAGDEYSIEELPEAMTEKLAHLYSWVADVNLVNFCEFKPSGAAFHWRGLPEDEIEYIRRKVTEQWHDIAKSTNLELYNFDGGVEIRVVGTHKATPVVKVLSEVDGDTIAAYLGDDLTDEDAFGAIRGRGLGVLVRNSIRETSADLWITPPHELKEFLRRWL